MESPALGAALRPYLAGRTAASRSSAQLLVEELASFLAHLGLPVDEEAGRRIPALPLDEFGPDLAWRFVADHLITHVSLPVARLARAGRLLGRALRDSARRGAVADRARTLEAARRADAAVRELPRLDALARALHEEATRGRPGRELYRRDPAAYAEAMRGWEEAQPHAVEELEGGFWVDAAGEDALVLRHLEREGPIELQLPAAAGRLARAGDRLDVQLGRGRAGGWFVMDAFAAAAPEPPA